MGCRTRSLLETLLERGLLLRGRTARLSSGLLLSPWGPQLPLVRAVGRPVTLLSTVPATVTRLRIARASTRPLSASPYSSCVFLLGTAHSRDSTFRRRLSSAELIGMRNSRPSLRHFSRDRVHEIGCSSQLPFMSRAVATLPMNSTGCNPAISSAVMIRAGLLSSLPREC